jgi:glycosyltransferase involved in cell wall biosynthesis
MKKLLFISYMFPPIAGSGIQRSLKFVKFLPDNGIQPIVFCPKKALWRASVTENDEYPFLKQTTIYRCGIRRLERYFNLRFQQGRTKHLHFYFLALKYIWYIDFLSAWYFECRKEALRIAREEKVNCVLTSSPPHSVHLFGMYLKKNLNLPWIMDLRDAMVDDATRNPSLSFRFESALQYLYEKKFYRLSDKIITVSRPIMESMQRRHPSLNLDFKTEIITNGFDDEDFTDLSSDPGEANVLTITYTGSFAGRQTPEYFLEAIRLLVKQQSVDASDLLIRFIGFFDEKRLAIIRNFRPVVPIEILDFQPYRQSLQSQINADLLLLVVSLTESEGGSQIFTGKFFEYIGAKKPIFALVPEGPLKETIENGRFGYTAPPKDIPMIAKKFKDLYDQWKQKGAISINPDPDLRKTFTRKQLTKQLALTVHEITR